MTPKEPTPLKDLPEPSAGFLAPPTPEGDVSNAMVKRAKLRRKVEEAFTVYRKFREMLEAIKAERSALTGPHYAAKNKIEKEFKPRVDAAAQKEKLYRAALDVTVLKAYKEKVFPEGEQRLTFDDQSWVQVEKPTPVLRVEDWWKFLQNEYVRENLVAGVTIEFNSVALAMAMEGKHIPGVDVTQERKVKIHVEKQKDTAKEA